MREFAFFERAPWIAFPLAAALGGGWYRAGATLDELDARLRDAEVSCAQVGRIAHDLRTLEDEKRRDECRRADPGVLTWFADGARTSGIDLIDDFTLDPKLPVISHDHTWQDTQYVLRFHEGHWKERQAIFEFIWEIERSPRMKLARVKLARVAGHANDDLWMPESLTFDRRDAVRPQ